MKTKTWAATGDGKTTTFKLAGRTSTDPRDYHVVIGGIHQPWQFGAYELPTGAETIVFGSAPPRDVEIRVVREG